MKRWYASIALGAYYQPIEAANAHRHHHYRRRHRAARWCN